MINNLKITPVSPIYNVKNSKKEDTNKRDGSSEKRKESEFSKVLKKEFDKRV